jgi:thioredoxin-related protein
VRSKSESTGAWTARWLRAVLGAAALVAAVAPAASAQEGPSLPSVKWSSLEEAGAASKTQKKPVFVMVYADWCGYCHKMDATTFRNPDIVGKLNGQYVPAKLNGESDKPLTFFKQAMTEAQWAQLQGVQGFPALIVVDPKGRTVVQYPGFLDTPTAEAFLGELSIFFKAGGIDKLGNFVDWSNKRRG